MMQKISRAGWKAWKKERKQSSCSRVSEVHRYSHQYNGFIVREWDQEVLKIVGLQSSQPTGLYSLGPFSLLRFISKTLREREAVEERTGSARLRNVDVSDWGWVEILGNI